MVNVKELLLLVILQWNITIAGAVMCYTCDHVAHPRDCDRIVQCEANESCHAVAYAQPDGHFYYNVGCLETTTCPANAGRRDIAFCNRCCHGDYCNKELCDAPPSSSHGPRCLQCGTVEDPTHCGAVVECAIGQMCFTQEKYVFGELRYELGCTYQGCAAPNVLGKRDGLCTQCCKDENCNRNLCLNTGSPYTQSLPSISSAIPTIGLQTSGKPTTGMPATDNAHTTMPITMTSSTHMTEYSTYVFDLPGCLYKGHVYHKGDTWEEKCQYTCTCEDDKTGRYVCQDICPTYIHVPDECHFEKNDGECCEHPVCPGFHIHVSNLTSSNFSSSILNDHCFYKNKTYYQGETWRDGCDYDCTCADVTRGYFTCTSVCYHWNLPDECHLEPPAAGKCCETPSCPPRFTINYPPGYKEQ